MLRHSQFFEDFIQLGLSSVPHAKIFLDRGKVLLLVFFIEGYSGDIEEHRVYIPDHLILPKSYFVFPGEVPGLILFDELRSLWVGREADRTTENLLYGRFKFNGDKSVCMH